VGLSGGTPEEPVALVAFARNVGKLLHGAKLPPPRLIGVQIDAKAHKGPGASWRRTKAVFAAVSLEFSGSFCPRDGLARSRRARGPRSSARTPQSQPAPRKGSLPALVLVATLSRPSAGEPGRDEFFGRNQLALLEEGLDAPEKLGSAGASGSERK
jgi:hypothetical protein